MSLLLGLEVLQMIAMVSGGGGGWWWWWSKGILEFRFGPNLRLEAWTKLNKNPQNQARKEKGER